MAVRPIRIVGDPVLQTPTRLVTEFGEELHTLVDDMFDTMAAAEGVGLAANQIGVDLRVFVYDCTDAHDVRYRGVAVNPVTDKTYVATRADNAVTVIKGLTVVATVPVGTYDRQLAVNPVTNRVCSAIVTMSRAFVPTSSAVM